MSTKSAAAAWQRRSLPGSSSSWDRPEWSLDPANPRYPRQLKRRALRRPIHPMKIVTPNRAVRSYTQRLRGAPEAVFPLLCPVREADWIQGWDPVLVVSTSGVAEADCVFTTKSAPADTIWYITRHEPHHGLVEMLKITPSVTACRLTILVTGVAGGSEAVVTYAHTSLGPEGDKFVASFTEEYYRGFMQDWEARLNHFLEHGSAMSAVA